MTTADVILLVFLIPVLLIVVWLGYSMIESFNVKDTFCVSNGFETYQNQKCVKITEDNKIKSRNVICIEPALIKFLPTKCGWDE